jgi:hypothetical protein
VIEEGKMNNIITADDVDVSIRVTPETGTLHIAVREQHVDAVRKALPFPTSPQDWMSDGPGWRLLIADLSGATPGELVPLTNGMAFDIINATELRVLTSKTKAKHVADEAAALDRYDAWEAQRARPN